MTVLCPRQCMAMKSRPVSAATWRMAGSASPPETSLMIATPASAAARAVAEFMVSTLTRMPRSTSSRMTGSTRFCSMSLGMRSAPGRVVSPPTSITSTPAPTIFTAWSIAACCWANSPPSLKESGVTLSTPMMRGRDSGTGSLLRLADEGHDLGALDRVGEDAAAGHRHGGTAHLLHPPRGHATVHCIRHHDHATRRKALVQGIRYLLGQPLLQLRARRDGVDHAGETAQPDDAVTGRVGDVGDAEERQKVVLADGTELDVAKQHQLAARVARDRVGQVDER